jgi:multidrug efflux system membrane fusion protein
LRTTYITAFVIAVLIGVWLLSGVIGQPPAPEHATLAEQNRRSSAQGDDEAPTRVRARVSHAETKTVDVQVRGRTENKRTVVVKAETGGRILERAVERGQRVQAGDLLCRIDLDDRNARLTEAKETVNQARLEYEGSLKLAANGLISETMTATTRARLASAEAALRRTEVDIEHTAIRAPFAGLVEDTHLERGDFVQPGTACATVIDLDPMLLVGRVAEREVAKLNVGSAAIGTLIDGSRVRGKVTFVGRQSDATTRTYPIEIEVDNADYRLPSGITTQITIPTNTLLAHHVSPSLLALDDAGRMGLRTVDENSRVVFTPVEILAEDGGRVWVSGLPDVINLITVGQELVIPGQRVEVDYERAADAPPAGQSETPAAVAGAQPLPAVTARRDSEPVKPS